MNIWDRILSSLQQKINRQSFNTWLKPTQQLAFADGTLHVEVPSLLFADWINRNYLPLIQESARDIEGSDLHLHFTTRHPGMPARQPSGPPASSAGGGVLPEGQVPSEEHRIPSVSDADLEPAARAASPRPGIAPGPQTLAPLGTGLNPRYSFDSFVVSSCNQFAHAAAVAVADQPSGAYNPLYIYGGVGLGKTHLMQAIGNRLFRNKSGVKHLYISTETFMNELINSIRFEKTIDFKGRYRNVDLLLIDDIQFLAGKERTQEEFFHTFNALYESQKQIVITSDCPPRDIPTLEERLRSRFEWGLIADIQPPDLETKVAILRKKAEERKIDLPQEVAIFIAERVRSNIRELEGHLNRVAAFASLTGNRISIDLAKEALKDLLTKENKPITGPEILKVVAAHYGLKVSDLKSKSNARTIAFP